MDSHLTDIDAANSLIHDLRTELSICRNALFIEDEYRRKSGKEPLYDYAIEGADRLLPNTP